MTVETTGDYNNIDADLVKKIEEENKVIIKIQAIGLSKETKEMEARDIAKKEEFSFRQCNFN